MIIIIIIIYTLATDGDLATEYLNMGRFGREMPSLYPSSDEMNTFASHACKARRKHKNTPSSADQPPCPEVRRKQK